MPIASKLFDVKHSQLSKNREIQYIPVSTAIFVLYVGSLWQQQVKHARFMYHYTCYDVNNSKLTIES